MVLVYKFGILIIYLFERIQAITRHESAIS